MAEGYTHGRHECALCHQGNSDRTVHGRWQLIQTAGYWGDSQPSTLILGFSMGENQVRVFFDKPFDQVAFARSRDRVGTRYLVKRISN